MENKICPLYKIEWLKRSNVQYNFIHCDGERCGMYKLCNNKCSIDHEITAKIKPSPVPEL